MKTRSPLSSRQLTLQMHSVSHLIDRPQKIGCLESRTNDQNKSFSQRKSSIERLHPMDDGALEITIENGSDVNKVEEQPDDEEPRYWFSCSFHCIAGGNISCRLLAGGLRGRRRREIIVCRKKRS